MLAHSDLQRSIANMTINLHRAIETRKHRADDYELAEREWQAQYEFAGGVGVLPAEGIINMPFGVTFIADAGNQRDSMLDRPHVRFGAEIFYGPKGIMVYHHIAQWQLDDDQNYIGADVTVGVHMPAMSIDGAMPTSFRFKGILHATFQGYGSLNDADALDRPFDSTGLTMD